MIRNDCVSLSFRMRALRNAKLIFKSLLHLFYVLVTFTQLQPYFTVLINVSCAWLKCWSFTAMHSTSNYKARFNNLIKTAYRCKQKKDFPMKRRIDLTDFVINFDLL